MSVFCSLTVSATQIAFPGAEGHGRYVSGGRGGKVYHVTTLEDHSNPGSLRYALNQSGARTIVFDVSGTIHLKSALRISKDNVTIAGQTAPGQGICVADFPVTIACNNIIMRFLRFRLGDLNAQEADALGGMDKKDIMIDHCSMSWSVDECCSVYGNENQTLQWCIISQSLRNSVHAKSTHGYGGNWGGNKASYHHNLVAHHESRTPRLGPRPGTQKNEYMDLRNNVFYNWAGNGCYGGEGMQVNIVNNYYKPGPATNKKGGAVKYRIAKIGIRTTDYVTRNPSFAPMLHVWGKFYVDGNLIEGNSEVSKNNWEKGIYAQINNSECDNLFTTVTRDTIKRSTPLETGYVTTHTAEKAYEKVLEYAGCSFNRDTHDEMIVNDTRTGKASYGNSGGYPGYIDSQNDLKPVNASSDWSAWPILVQNNIPADSDGDGMPDEWERKHGLNPNDSSDGVIIGKDGYTNLENYLNDLVSDIIFRQNEDAILSSSPEIEQSEVRCYTKDNRLH
ncbi:MAG: hypothetical protein RR346_08290, partial [Bacteroidales bacterium]